MDNKKRNVWKRVGRFVFSKLKRVYVSLSVIDYIIQERDIFIFSVIKMQNFRIIIA